MRPKVYPLLEQTIEDGIRFYLLNRVNKYVRRVQWVREVIVFEPFDIVSSPRPPADPVAKDLEVLGWDDAELEVRKIAIEAADHIMNCIAEAFTFTDDEAVVPSEDDQESTR